jgi:hypothetical protein
VRVGRVALGFLAVLWLVEPAGAAEATKKDGSAHRAGKIVEAGESAGKEFGHDAAEVGREAWGKAQGASAAAAEEVRRATREFWRDVIEEKERLLAKLRRENRELRARQAQ